MPRDWPGLSVIVPAYLEGAVIAAKLDDVTRNGYPGALELIVVAEDPETATAAREAGARVLETTERLGKSGAINSGMAAATEEVVVITDADTELAPGALTALARWFGDSGVGAVAGEKRVRGEGQALYWRYESWLKERESRSGTTVALVGELIALRRSLFTPLPADVVVDDLWIGLDVLERGRRIPYEPSAVAVEAPSGSLGSEWERRTRTTAGLLDALWRRRRMLAPGTGPAATQLWGHKLLRLLFGPLAHLALLAQAVRAGRSAPLAAGFIGVHVLASAALFRGQRGASLTTVERAGAQFLFLQATAVGGIVRYLRGGRPAIWPKVDRSTGAGN